MTVLINEMEIVPAAEGSPAPAGSPGKPPTPPEPANQVERSIRQRAHRDRRLEVY